MDWPSIVSAYPWWPVVSALSKHLKTSCHLRLNARAAGREKVLSKEPSRRVHKMFNIDLIFQDTTSYAHRRRS